MSKKKETVILTGAAGFVGINMTKHLIDEGYHVIGLDINDEGLKIIEEIGAEALKCDMLKEDLVPIFKRGDYLIHIAGLFKFDAPANALFLINVKLSKVVMEAANKVGNFKHILYFSSVGTYGTPAKNRKSRKPHLDVKPYKESDPLIPDNTYGLSKYLGEKFAWRYHKKGLPISIIRPSLIYGPYNRYGMALFHQLGSYCKNLMTGPTKYVLLFPMALPCRGGTYAHFVHVEDLCRACSLIMTREDTIGEAYTIGDMQPADTITFFNLMLSPFRVKINWKLIPLSRFVIKNFNKFFNKYITKLLERVLSFCFKIYGWRMNYNPDEIPLEISSDWLGYFSSNFLWDISKLLALGFKHKYPTLKRGVLEACIWYKKHKWLP